jgi:hypothetical protein
MEDSILEGRLRESQRGRKIGSGDWKEKKSAVALCPIFFC